MIFRQSNSVKIFAVFFLVCVLFSVFSVFTFAAEPITDLTGTTWVVNSVFASGYGLEIASLDGQPICIVIQDAPSNDFVISPDTIYLGGNSDCEPSIDMVWLLQADPFVSAELVPGATITFYDTSASTDEDLILFMQESLIS